MPAFPSRLAVTILVPALLLAPGRLSADEELATVSGVVTLDGKPLAGARVLFHVGDGQFVGGKTDENGKYKVARVPVGTHSMTVEMPPGSKVRLPDKYSSEDRAVLRADVPKQGANQFNLDLASR